MASFRRLFARFPRNSLAFLRPSDSCRRCVSTTGRFFDASPAVTNQSALEETKEFQENVKRFEDLSEDLEDNWVGYGFDPYDREVDYWSYHIVFYCMYSFAFMTCTFIIAYHPDFKDQHWTQREAYLELARREKEGLPLIDSNLVPYEKLMNSLPSDEELGDAKIII